MKVDFDTFVCRVCGYNKFDILGPEFYCLGCSTIFRNPRMFSVPTIYFAKLSENAKLPTKAHDSDSGYDLYSTEDFELHPQDCKLIKTDIAVKFPKNIAAQIRPRSGMNMKQFWVPIGTIDSAYTGNLGVIIKNLSNNSVKFNKYDRIAQLVFEKVISTNCQEISLEKLNETVTDRGSSGFGSSDNK